MGIEERLRRLEERSRPSGASRDPRRDRLWERYFHAHENARREIQGLEPLPDLPYTEEDYENDLDTLQETIPAYRESPGYQSGEGKKFLDDWQQRIEEKLQKGRER